MQVRAFERYIPLVNKECLYIPLIKHISVIDSYCPYILASLDLVARKPVFGGLQTTKAQTSLRLRRLIISFIIHVLESMIYRPAISEISIFLKVSVAEKADFNITLSENPEDRSSRVADIPCLGWNSPPTTTEYTIK